MNYFEFYMGDYARDTAHLSLAEHGAYLLLLSACYGTEKALPGDYGALYRIARAMEQDEQAAVRKVADQFFPVGQDGLRHNERVKADIAKALQRIEAARTNGAKGGRKPKQNPVGSDPQTQPFTQPKTEPPTQEQSGSKAHQTPYTNQKKKLSCASADADAPQRPDPIPYQGIIDLYNATMTRLPRVRELTPKRRTLIRAAWNASPERQSLDFWKSYFEECEDDPFNNGTGPYREPHANWRPTFDYLLRADVVTRVFEVALDRMERGQ